MSGTAVERPARLRRIRRALLIGALLLVPRIVLAWLVLPSQYDLSQLIVTLVFVAGLFVIGGALLRLWLLRSDRLLPVALIGFAALLAAGLALRVRPPGTAAIAYSGGVVAPPEAALQLWFYLLIGGVSQLGLVLLVGAIGTAISRWAGRRAV